jgi:dCMP deaminase
MDWDQYFITMCYLVGMKSKDPWTWVGSVIVGPDNEIRSTGYNSLPRGMNDNVKERFQKPVKDFLVEHAERNAIYNASRMGIDIKGCRLYVNHRPCAVCMRGIQQSGIVEVITHAEYPDNLTNQDMDTLYTNLIASECNIKYRMWSGNILDLKGLKKGINFNSTDIRNTLNKYKTY